MWATLDHLLAETLVCLPELRPRQARRATHEDVGMILTLLVLDAKGIVVAAGQTTRGERPVDVFTRMTDDDQS